MVTPAYAMSDRRTQSGEGVPASGLSHQGSGRAQGLVQSGVERPGAAGATTRANDSAGGRATLPVQYTVTPTVGTGTSTVNPALQAFLVDTLSQALQRFSVTSEAPTPTLRAQATAPVSRHMATSTEYTRTEPDRLMRSPMAGHLGSVSPRVTLPTPTSTPVGMSMAVIPSYGGVSIQVPSANRDEVENGTLRPGAFYPPFQPPMTTMSGWNSTGTLPAWSAAPATPTPVKYGNWGERYQTRTELPHGPDTNQPNSQEGWYGTPASGSYSRQNVPIPTALRNAVKVIVPSYSDTATSERAAAFWRSFEKCTYGMDGQMRLTAFEQCLKGKVGQEWWYNSRIDSFEALRVRFHNRFICQTPAQLWNRLKAAKRNRGESAEEWGDRIVTMFEARNYYEPRMRYEFFLDGLRNKQMRAVLNASMVTSIPEACTLLLYKNLYLPVEEEGDFAGDGTLPSSASSSTSTQSQMFQQLQQMNQMMLKQQQSSGTHCGFVNAVAPTAPEASGVPTSDGNANANLGPLNIRLGPDTRTTKEISCVVDVGARAAVARIVRVGEAVVIGASVTATIPWSATGRGLKAILETGNVAFLSVTSASRRATQWQCVRTLAIYEGW
ncbi:hypothetical protein PI124_g15797 [Phytophthora idaei]|nr:hypothetical protein PI125_g10051 [Phytophthora idaei]KAG3143018.1 hypothetical protein PI126_g14808 [Phytophthora idaei]KAG3239261.1 hypothetical protein PI124_g15797 [Phytophthora idaei]